MTGPDYEISKTAATEDEVAAVITVLHARAAANSRLKAAEDRPLAGGWKSYYRTLRPQLIYGRDAWRTYMRF